MNITFKVMLLLLYMGESAGRKRSKDFQQLLRRRRNKEKQKMNAKEATRVDALAKDKTEKTYGKESFKVAMLNNERAVTSRMEERKILRKKNFSTRKEGDMQEDNKDLELEDKNNLMSSRKTYNKHDNRNEFYKFDQGPLETYTNNEDWMSYLPRDTKFRDLSLPGTHDTMAYKRHISSVLRCQCLTLMAQLESGVRALDIRCKLINGRCNLHHAHEYLGFDLYDVLDTIDTFLDANRDEFIFMRIKRETGDGDMEVVWNWYRARTQYVHLFNQASNLHTAGANPILSDIQGKIVWYRMFSEWPDDYVVQDEYHIHTMNDLYEDKWEVVKDALQSSRASRRVTFYPFTRNYFMINDNSLHINFLSVSGVQPWRGASGHSDQRTDGPFLSTGLSSFYSTWPDFPRSWGFIWYKGINYLFGEYLNELAVEGFESADGIHNNGMVHAGIVFADFPGKDLINTIIQQNFVRPPGMGIRFRIDCHHDTAGNEYTSNQVVIRLKNKYHQTLIYSSSNGISSCGVEKVLSMSGRQCPYSYGGDRCEIGYVEMQTYGSDAFLIDRAWIREIRMFATDGAEIVFGVDNRSWWCLSQDHREWNNSMNCYHILRFYYRDDGSYERGEVYGVQY